MRLFELFQTINEGPRQDKVAELFKEFEPLIVRDENGTAIKTTEFRRAVLNGLVRAFDGSDGSKPVTTSVASNLYNAYMRTAGIPGLSNAEKRAAAGKAPVRARGSVLDTLPSEPDSLPVAQNDMPKTDDDEDSELKAMLYATEQFDLDGEKDEDDIEWYRDQDNTTGHLVVEWRFAFSHESAVKTTKINNQEIHGANAKLHDVGSKFRNRVVSYQPATIEKAKQSDESFKGAPSTTRYLRGKLVLEFL